MINEIKAIIKNCLNAERLCCLMNGTVTNNGIKVSDKLTVSNALIKGNLKDFVTVGGKVRLIRNHGGNEFFIIEIIGDTPVIKGMTLEIEPITIAGQTIDHISIKEVSK